ncbi:MAG TPA: hypothetical protein VEX39_11175 [Thermoleophilaceae bacterium]|nr:hypothetical protein [Thermoleophilaceae bacterium]
MAVRGEATIERVTATGVTVDRNPELQFELLVALPDREPYRVSHRLVVSDRVQHRFGAGRAVPVSVDATGTLAIG